MALCMGYAPMMKLNGWCWVPSIVRKIVCKMELNREEYPGTTGTRLLWQLTTNHFLCIAK